MIIASLFQKIIKQGKIINIHGRLRVTHTQSCGLLTKSLRWIFPKEIFKSNLRNIFIKIKINVE